MTPLAKMSRLGVYAAVSTALAAGVVVSAFHQRPNFYSACVYLSQSNLCLMIIINLILLIYTSLMYGLQRLCYGPLRPIEIEQLYEKGWFAVTETCLAMTIFREEVGAWFLVMFVALLTGKVWGWIGDGRVEVLEQQPPANPRLFHIRLCVSLTMSSVYDIWLMTYTIKTVIQQARPNMMVMFLFEFAVLTTCSFATAIRYGISLIEAKITKQQTIERMAERRREVRDERAEMIRQREAVAAGTATDEEAANIDTDAPLPSEDDVDEMDLEVPGWEAKGQWVLTLDLVTDFVKLLIYVTFFVILLMFYGLPIHIMRDLFMTGRSFTKRLAAFLRYRRATHDMNTKYEDATVEDIAREDTCIICREEMRPWSVTNPPVPAGQQPPARSTGTVNERSRPKKLPCGHILHLGCLKSWLERQQACPTCRRSVVEAAHTRPEVTNDGNAPAQGVAQAPGQNGPNVPAAPPRRGNMRMLNIGPLRLGFGQGNLRDIAGGIDQPGQGNQAQGANPRVYGLELGFPRRAAAQAQPQGTENHTTAETLQDQIREMEQTIMGEIRSLQLTQQQLQLIQLLQAELSRLQDMQNGVADPLAPPAFQIPQIPQMPVIGQRPVAPTLLPAPAQYMERHTVRPGTVGIPSGSLDLPPGVSIPEGWTLLPMHRMEGPPGSSPSTHNASPAGPVSSSGLATTATTQAHNTSFSPTSSSSNNNITPTHTQSSEIPHQSQASSVDSSDTNAIHTPSSPSASTFLNAPGQGSSEFGPNRPFPPTLPHSAGEGGPIIDSPRTAGEISNVESDASSYRSTDQERLVRENRLRRLNEDMARNAEERRRAQAEEMEKTEGSDSKGKARAVSIEDAEDEDA